MSERNSEHYRRAALAIANASRQSHATSAIVSSATAGEGATTACVFMGRHLLHDFGLRPVLIETNRFRPSFTRLFRLKPEKSLAAVAAGKAEVMDCVQKDSSGLSMIPAGTFDAAELPSLEKTLCRSVQELQNHFDYILLDAPPVLESADVAITGRVVPNAILVVGSGRTSQTALRRAGEELREAHIRVVGTILNQRKRIIPRWLDAVVGR